MLIVIFFCFFLFFFFEQKTAYEIHRLLEFRRVLFLSGTFGLFIWERDHGASIELARTVAVNTLVMFEIFYLFSARFLAAPSLTRTGLYGNRYVLYAIGLLIIFQLALTYAPPMQLMFGTADMSGLAWLRVIAVGSSVLFLVEIEKWLIRKFRSQ